MKVQESKYVFQHCELTQFLHSNESKTWGNLAEKICPHLIETFPLNQHKSYHRMLMSINVQYSCPQSNIHKSWTLLKQKEDFQQFHKRLKRQGIQHVVSSSLKKKASFFSELKKDSSLQENEKFIHYLQKVSVNPKMFSHVIFQQFVNNCLPHSKKHLNIKGQIIISEQSQKTFSILPSCFFIDQEKPSTHQFCLTLTAQMIIISEKHFYFDEAIQVIPFSRHFKLNYHYRKGKYILVIKSLRLRFQAKFGEFSKMMKAAIMINMTFKQSNYWKANKHQSFAPQRPFCQTKMFMDAEQYFSELYHSILQAKNKICITDWWLSPSFSLKQPDTNGQFRFDTLLKTAAQKQVKIFIILFRESRHYSNINSQNVEEHLEKLHENITVIRHPNPLIPTLWSHHQKLIIIDEQVAFLGGFDICDQRWNTKKQINQSCQQESSSLWHDTAIKINGPSVVDIQRHFAQYWYFVIKDLLQKPSSILKRLTSKISEIATEDIYFDMLSNQNFNDKDSDVQDIANDQIIEDQSSVSDSGKYSISTRDTRNSQLQKSYYLAQFQKKAETVKNLIKQGHKNIEIFTNEKMQSKFFEVLVEGSSKKEQNGNMKVQILRSASSWSIGLRNKRIECSIYNAYKEAIKNARKYIYIENQSFIGNQNKIMEILAQRIQNAHERGQEFKVIVVLPLTPKLPTDANDKQSITFKKQMKLQYETIKNNQNSFFNRLSHIDNLHDYIHFFGLRTHSMSTSGPVTKQIYVNSKLMIVDDQTMIIGSANISDRSMLGNRDSEVAVMVQSDEISNQIANLREKLFVENFDLAKDQAKDFIGSWQTILKASKNNTLIYRQVFGCAPDNNIYHFSQIEKLKIKADIKKYNEKKQDIKGFAVDFPLDFLKNQQINAIGVQQCIPFETFT